MIFSHKRPRDRSTKSIRPYSKLLCFCYCVPFIMRFVGTTTGFSLSAFFQYVKLCILNLFWETIKFYCKLLYLAKSSMCLYANIVCYFVCFCASYTNAHTLLHLVHTQHTYVRIPNNHMHIWRECVRQRQKQRERTRAYNSDRLLYCIVE